MLLIVATPIGNPEDISLRAKQALKECDLLVLEETKEGIKQLKSLDLPIPKIEKLNEHTTEDDLQFLAEQCQKLKVALITDCGTPGFCDPGSRLVKVCRQKNIPVQTLPGPSSLMALLSLSSERIDRFHFDGFLPRDATDRANKLKSILKNPETIIILETPYRCGKLLSELRESGSKRKILVATGLTQPTEWVWEGSASTVPKSAPEEAEVAILFYAETSVAPRLVQDSQQRRPQQARPLSPQRSRPPSRHRPRK